MAASGGVVHNHYYNIDARGATDPAAVHAVAMRGAAVGRAQAMADYADRKSRRAAFRREAHVVECRELQLFAVRLAHGYQFQAVAYAQPMLAIAAVTRGLPDDINRWLLQCRLEARHALN